MSAINKSKKKSRYLGEGADEIPVASDEWFDAFTSTAPVIPKGKGTTHHHSSSSNKQRKKNSNDRLTTTKKSYVSSALDDNSTSESEDTSSESDSYEVGSFHSHSLTPASRRQVLEKQKQQKRQQQQKKKKFSSSSSLLLFSPKEEYDEENGNCDENDDSSSHPNNNDDSRGRNKLLFPPIVLRLISNVSGIHNLRELLANGSDIMNNQRKRNLLYKLCGLILFTCSLLYLVVSSTNTMGSTYNYKPPNYPDVAASAATSTTSTEYIASTSTSSGVTTTYHSQPESKSSSLPLESSSSTVPQLSHTISKSSSLPIDSTELYAMYKNSQETVPDLLFYNTPSHTNSAYSDPLPLKFSEYPPGGPAICILVTNSTKDVTELKTALKSLIFLQGDSHPKYKAPILLFNEGDLSKEQKEEIISVMTLSGRPIAFPIVDFNSFPEGFDPNNEGNGGEAQFQVRGRKQWGYYHMIRFWITGIWKHPALSHFETIMRMDSDSCFKEMNDYLPNFMSPNLYYHSQYVGFESGAEYVDGLYDFALKYIKTVGNPSEPR